MKTLSKGIYRDGDSIRAIVNCAAGRKEKRFDVDAPLAEIKKWRNATKTKLEARERQRRPRDATGTLRADVTAYVATLTTVSWKSTRAHLEAWVALYGDRRRDQITEDDVRAAVRQWQAEDFKPWTIIHRVKALRGLYRALKDETTPCDAVTFDKPATRPVFVASTVIRKVALKLATRPAYLQTLARHLVLTSTGCRPCELMRAEPADVDVRARLWPIRTAKGGYRPALRLNDDMVAAWRLFARAKAWGLYDTSRHAKRLYWAGWPAGVPPYKARGTFGMELSRRGADLADIQELLGHADLKTTRAYYVPAENSRLGAAVRSVRGRLGWEKLAANVGRRQKSKKSA